MMPFFTSLLRAIATQLHLRMLLLTLLPLLIGLLLWGLLLWQGLQPLIDQLHHWFFQYSLFASVGELRRALVDGAMRVIRAIRGARASRAGRIDRNSQRQTVLATEEGRRRAICHLDNPRALACSHVHRSLPSSSIGSPAARRSAERHVLIGLFTS